MAYAWWDHGVDGISKSLVCVIPRSLAYAVAPSRALPSLVEAPGEAPNRQLVDHQARSLSQGVG